MLKFTKKPQIQGIRNAIANKQDFGITKWRSEMAHKNTDSLTVCMILKNYTNYNQIKDTGFWAQEYSQVKSQLIYFYSSVLKLDSTLESACYFGLKRHLYMYKDYNKIAVDYKNYKKG